MHILHNDEHMHVTPQNRKTRDRDSVRLPVVSTTVVIILTIIVTLVISLAFLSVFVILEGIGKKSTTHKTSAT